MVWDKREIATSLMLLAMTLGASAMKIMTAALRAVIPRKGAKPLDVGIS